MEIDVGNEDIAPDPPRAATAAPILPDNSGSPTLISDRIPPLSQDGTDESQSAGSLLTKLREKDDEIIFLKNTIRGLQDEIADFELHNRNITAAHLELAKLHKHLQTSHRKLAKDSEKESAEFQAKMNEMQTKVDDITASSGKFLNVKAKKPYHDLKATQKSLVHRQIRNEIAPRIDELLEKRELTVNQVVVQDINGQNPPIKIDTKPHRTFQQLTPLERETVAILSDSNSITRTSFTTYAAKRAIIKDLPPTSHLKEHHAIVMASLPKIIPAPVRKGGFLDIRGELKLQMEQLNRLDLLDLSEPVYVKGSLDATQYKHNGSMCIYTVEAISKGTEIGLVGLVEGGDGGVEMDESAGPFFDQILELDKNPIIQTDFGEVPVEVKGGGDLCNLYAQLGLCAATAKHSCPLCVLPKLSFWSAAFDPDLTEACNDRRLGRTRGNIMNEAVKTNPSFSVKGLPRTPLPRDPNALIISWMLICSLHIDLRLAG